ncbi:cupin domain-containing protein [Leptolyngbya sp. FACHB-36]|uniref:cupin domain-containing protein n=1 Tax=Leptolyngbya sp. FACHB-36 TaxID=2692808 RepID=UPI00168171BA|nr:cupin domain-containing protein [Leptolyngbya sp. FACHB-36]MBD2021760.1 cupin domain-containing protein [Leptolyngbya sp. FACHB-36]
MTDSTEMKVSAAESATGQMGQKYLAAGERVALRLWDNEPPNPEKQQSTRDYETVGYVLKGRAVLHLDSQQISLQPGDSWIVPSGTVHAYEILEPFTAIEATSPPAQENGRDRP